jgi:hypothetical protein
MAARHGGRRVRRSAMSLEIKRLNLAVPIDVALQRIRDTLATNRPCGQGIGIG